MVGCHVPGARIPVLVGGGALGMRYAVFAASVAVGMAPRLALALWVGVSFGNAFAEYLDMHPSVYVVISALVALAMIGAAWRLRDAWASHPAEPVDS
jgi:membrane protein DedA with SNARE-associated domain